MKASKNLVKKAKKEPQAVYQAGLAAESQGRLQDALDHYEALLEVLPRDLSLKIKQGSLLIGLGQFNQARLVFLKLAQNEPSNASHYSNLGICLSNQSRFDEAIATFRRALVLKPEYAMAWNNLGGAQRESGQVAESRMSYHHAIMQNPAYATATWGLAIVSLMLGDYEQGLPLYESGFQCGERIERFSAKPRWDGRASLKGKRLLILAEQGYGDAIQMARYVFQPTLADTEIIFEAQAPLIPLLQGLRPGLSVITKGDDPGPHDVYCPIMSLPLAFATGVDSIPKPAVFRIDPAVKEKWNQRLGAPSRRRIGLAWSGNPEHKNDKNRSMPVDALLPLLRLDAEFHVVQKGIRSPDLPFLRAHPEIQDHDRALEHFGDTAALIDAMDLIVSVDTSLVHLAGSLNKPCHALIAFAPDYRWLLERKDSPWYPSLVLHRQAAIGDWPSAIESALAAIRANSISPL